MKRKSNSGRKPKTQAKRELRTRLTADMAQEIDDLLENEQFSEAHELILRLESRLSFDDGVYTYLMMTATEVEDAEALERAAIALNRTFPRDPVILQTLANAYGVNYRPALELRTLLAFLKLFPTHEDAAGILETLDEVRADVARSLEIFGFKDEHDLAAYEEIRSLMSRADVAVAKRLADSLARKYNSNVFVLNIVVAIDIVQGDWTSTANAAMKVLEVDPNDIFALSTLAQAHRNLGNIDRAKVFAARLMSSKGSLPNWRVKAALGLLFAGEFAGILALYDQAAAAENADQMSGRLAHFAAVASYRLGDKNRARELWNQALEISPGLEIASDNLIDLDLPEEAQFGVICLDMTELVMPRALTAIRNATVQVPDTSPDAAKKVYRKLLRQHPEIASTAEIIYDLGDKSSLNLLLALTAGSGDPRLIEEAERFIGSGKSTIKTREMALTALLEYDDVYGI